MKSINPKNVDCQAIPAWHNIALLLFILIPLIGTPLAQAENSQVIDGVDGVDGLGGANALALSAQGNHLYATGFFDNAVAVFSRDTNTGVLTFQQVIKNSDIGNNGLQGPNAIAVSPDNKHVYVASTTDNAIVVFTRDPSSGQLTLAEIQQNGVNGVEGLAGASAIAISSDNQRLYVTGTRDNAIVVFERDVNTGTLTFLQKQQDGVNNVDGLAGATAVAVSKDNLFIYVTGKNDNAVAVFSRNPQQGELAFVAAYKNGVQPDDGPTITGLSGAYAVTVSPNNNHVYVVSNTDNALVAFSRNASTGELTYLQTHQEGTNNINGLSGARGVAIRPDGSNVYVAGVNDDALAVFNRDTATGLLEFKQAISNSSGITTLDGVTAVTTSPDGALVYTAALFSNAVTAFSLISTDLQVTMTAPTQVAINKDMGYSIIVTNNGPDTATGVTLTDTLPIGVTFDTASPGCSHNASNNVVTCALGTLEKEKAATVTVTVTTPAAVGSGTLTNKVEVAANQTDTNTANNTVSKTTQLLESVPTADLKVEIATAPQTVTVNMPLIYTVTVTNLGPDIANNVVLTNTLPAGVTYNAEDSDVRCTESAKKTGTVTCQLNTGNTEGATQVLIHVTTPATTGPLTFTASVSATEFDPTPDNNTATKENTVSILEVDLAIVDAVATPSTTGVEVGTEITYTLNVANQGKDTASGVALTATIPPQLSYVSNTDDDNCAFAQAKLTCNINTLAPAATKEIGLTVKALQTGTDIATTFAITGNGTDTNESNNSKSIQLNNITGTAADFVVTIDDGGQSILLGNIVTYTVTVTNNGPAGAGAKLDITLTGNNVVIGTITGDNCGTGTQFSCTLEAIAAGANKAVTIEATPTELGNLTLTAKVTSEVFDPTLPNTATQQTAVSNKESNLNIALKADPSPALTQNNLIYTSVVTNSGPHQATAVIVTQELPATVTYISAGGDQGEACSQSEKTVTCPLGPLNKDDTATVIIVVKPQTVGKLSSTASVSSDTFDPSQSDNTAKLETEVSQSTADIGLTITDAPDPVLVDNPLTYTITLTNNGPEAANNINLINKLPNNVEFKSPATISPAEINGTCLELKTSPSQPASQNGASAADGSTRNGASAADGTSQQGDIICTIDNLPKEGTATITLIVQPTTVGNLSFTASLQGKEFDPNTDNNQAQADTRVNNPSTLFFVQAQKNGLNGVQGLSGATALTLSPDGEHLYAAGFNDNALAVFTRNPNNGQLKFAQVLLNGTNNVEGLAAASGVSISPDGAFVYATGFSDNAVAVFKRDALSGTLTFLEVHQEGINGVAGLAGAFALTVTDNHVYIAGAVADAIALFTRDTTTGKLTFKQAFRVEDEATQLDGVSALAISPDGLHLLATSTNNNRLSLFSRDTTSGILTLQQTLANNTEGVQGLDKAVDVVISADGQSVYTVGRGIDNAIAVFNRSPETGTLTFVEIHRDGVDSVDGLNGASGLAISPEDDYVYVAGRNDNALAAFRRHPDTGKLTFVDVRTDGIDEVDGLAGASAVAVSPGGAHVYVTSLSDNAVAVLSIATADLNVTLSESEEPINVGDNLVYSITVTNNGPHQATGVTLEDSLPEKIALISFSPSQGTCIPTPTQDQINCTLGSLANGASVTLNLVVSPIDIGELTNKVTVWANQYDPSSPSTATETTQVVAEADLWLSINATPEPARIETALTYEISITNNGPDDAKNLSFTNQIPDKVKYVSAQVSTDTTPCFFDENTRTVTCTISRLAAGTNSLITLVVTPNTADVTLTNTATVTASAFDTNLPNNTATKTTQVVFNTVEDTYDNSGNNLHNYIVKPTGAVIGGTLSGTIQNQGLISEVQILANTTVSGGKLSKTITNKGLIENVQLLSDTVINGGTLRGNITGFPTAPATLNAHIAADTQLSHVIIGLNSQLDANVILGQGVTFAANHLIPAGIDLTKALPSIQGPITGSTAVDLSKDVLLSGGPLLDVINAIPDLKNNNLAFSQAPDTGHLLLPLSDENLVLMPIKVQQASSANTTATMTIHTDGSVTFLTKTGREILAQPAPQKPADLQAILANAGITQLKASANGNLMLTTIDQYQIRPELYTRLAEPSLPLGIFGKPSPLLEGFTIYLFRFEDDAGVRHEQLFYPAPAHPKELHSFLQGIPGATTVEIHLNGKISVKIGARTYSAVPDYTIKPSNDTSNTITQMLIVPDENGDDSEDLWITYTNGDRQILYLQPFPEVAAEIQAIQSVATAGYVVSQNQDGDYILTQEDKRLVMKTTSMTQITENTPPGMTIHPDGSTDFITETGLKITTQPQVQDIPALEAQLRPLGLPTVAVETNGNLTLPYNDTLSFSARPDLQSTPAFLGMPLGLHYFPTTLPSVLTIGLVFINEEGHKRLQHLYPAAKYPQKLQNFLTNTPGVEAVRLDLNGTLTVTGGANAFTGIIDYTVEIGNTPTGGLQLNDIPDANGDGVNDLAIMYGSGEKQIIYQIPPPE